MFGTQPRARRPLLLILVFGALLAIIGITATGPRGGRPARSP